MKIQYASDLHLEFAENSSFLKHNPLIPMGEVLVLVGDIGYIGDENYSKLPLWDWVSDNFERCIVIPGNHEFYKFFDVSQLYNGWELSIRSNITCYYNSVIDLSQEIVLIGTTLWSNIEQHNAYFTEKAITDFRRIKNKENNLSWIDFNALHQQCLDFLQESIERHSSKKIVVATHHVPSVELMSPEFTGSSLNGAFVVELGRFIQNAPIDYWVYGHSHRNIERIIGATKCLSNQLGYVFRDEHLDFILDKHFVI